MHTRKLLEQGRWRIWMYLLMLWCSWGFGLKWLPAKSNIIYIYIYICIWAGECPVLCQNKYLKENTIFVEFLACWRLLHVVLHHQRLFLSFNLWNVICFTSCMGSAKHNTFHLKWAWIEKFSSEHVEKMIGIWKKLLRVKVSESEKWSANCSEHTKRTCHQ
jgi:hypothetical protein